MLLPGFNGIDEVIMVLSTATMNIAERRPGNLSFMWPMRLSVSGNASQARDEVRVMSVSCPKKSTSSMVCTRLG